jgi:hypothetical protein
MLDITTVKNENGNGYIIDTGKCSLGELYTELRKIMLSVAESDIASVPSSQRQAKLKAHVELINEMSSTATAYLQSKYGTKN